MSNAKFRVDMRRFVENTKADLEQVTRKVLLDIGTRLVERSPVGDASYWQHPPPKGYVGGRFRASWQFSEGVAAPDQVYALDATVFPVAARVLDALQFAVLDQTGVLGKRVFFTNNVPYALRIEDGWSRQAPAGIVGLVVVEFGDIVRKAAAEVRA